MSKAYRGYVIGVDGGGTKTIAASADLNGKILKIGKAGSSSARNIGIKAAVQNIAGAIRKILPKNKIKIHSIFIGLPGIQERPELAPKIQREFFSDKKISLIFKGKIKIVSDQIVAFRAGTDKKDGIVLIAGTGCVAHGWKEQKEHKSSGWGWLADEGSAFWVSQKALKAIWKELDGRGPKTLITKLIFKELRIKNKEDLIEKVYFKNPFKNILPFSYLVDRAAEKEDKIAKNILIEAGEELALSANTVIKKLNFKNKKFPLVLIGSMFNSKILLNTTKKEVKKFAPKAKIIRPKAEPVIGAVKLAIEELDK